MIMLTFTYCFYLSIQTTFISLQKNTFNMNIDIDTLLKEKKLSKTDVAKKMELSRESLYRILSGNPTLDNISKLADAIGVSIPELFTANSQDLYGHVEYKGVVYTIKSRSDLENLLKIVD